MSPGAQNTPGLNRPQLHRIQIGSLLRQFSERWRAYQVYLAALVIFVASRLVVVTGVKFGTLLVRVPDPSQWDAGNAWYDRLLRWDSGWFADIITEGYRYTDNASVESSTAFYPLYPLVSAALKSFGVDTYLALLLVANVASLLLALLFVKLVKDELGEEVALLSLACFFFFPSSVFLSAGYSESLCLLFIMLSFILLSRGKLVSGSAIAGLSLAARISGVVMIPVILWEIWSQNRERRLHLVLKMALCGILASSGLLLYMAYLGIEFGHPMAFATSQVAWHSGTFLERLLAAATLHPFRYSSTKIDGVLMYSLSGLFIGFLALALWSFRRLRFAVALYGLGALMLPYLTVGITGSMNRFVLMCFPAFMCLGIICKGRPWLTTALIGIFAALLLCETALFSQWYRVG